MFERIDLFINLILAPILFLVMVYVRDRLRKFFLRPNPPRHELKRRLQPKRYAKSK